MIKAVLFDMDGVLIDAKEWHYEALNRALHLFGMAIDREAHLATFDGLPTRVKLDMLTRTRGLPSKLNPLINALKQAHTAELAYAKCRPSFNHRDALSRLQREGYRLAVCSNSIRQTVDLLIRLAGLEDYIEFQISNEDVVNPKPDPEIYRNAMERFNVTPEETLILEDNEHGIAAARASGAHVLQIGTPEHVTYERIKRAIQELEQA